jgi:hypothetical protein
VIGGAYPPVYGAATLSLDEQRVFKALNWTGVADRSVNTGSSRHLHLNAIRADLVESVGTEDGYSGNFIVRLRTKS